MSSISRRLCFLSAVAMTLLAGFGCYKTTGGGWFYDSLTGAKITFGLTAQPVGDPYDCGVAVCTQGAKGNLQLVDHSTVPPQQIKGNFEGTVYVSDPFNVPIEAAFTGECSMKGVGEGCYLGVLATDLGEPGAGPGDLVTVYCACGDGYLYSGNLRGGNIQVHFGEEL